MAGSLAKPVNLTFQTARARELSDVFAMYNAMSQQDAMRGKITKEADRKAQKANRRSVMVAAPQ